MRDDVHRPLREEVRGIRAVAIYDDASLVGAVGEVEVSAAAAPYVRIVVHGARVVPEARTGRDRTSASQPQRRCSTECPRRSRGVAATRLL